MSREALNISRSGGETACARLAHFFPQATPVRIPVQVSRLDAATVAVAEQTMIEFGTSAEVLFASALPLEFEDRIQVRNSDGTFEVKAEIVAMQLDQGKRAVAARFLQNVTNWIIKK
jgi:hypothetical protein